jgi:hypothetical protein
MQGSRASLLLKHPQQILGSRASAVERVEEEDRRIPVVTQVAVIPAAEETAGEGMGAGEAESDLPVRSILRNLVGCTLGSVVYSSYRNHRAISLCRIRTSPYSDTGTFVGSCNHPLGMPCPSPA